mgnify:CR=1 FL=1
MIEVRAFWCYQWMSWEREIALEAGFEVSLKISSSGSRLTTPETNRVLPVAIESQLEFLLNMTLSPLTYVDSIVSRTSLPIKFPIVLT